MDQQSVLTALLQDQYGSHAVNIQPIHTSTDEDQGIYRVHLTSAESTVLHVFHHEKNTTALLRQATILEYLAQRNFPAPRLIPTRTHKPIGKYQNRCSLMLNFIEGAHADLSTQNLTMLAAMLGKLHRLTEHVMTGGGTPLPGSRFQLSVAIPYALSQLLPEAHRIPTELWPFYKGMITALHRMQQTNNLPNTLVHANCWPQNAICTRQGEMIITHWDGAGIGPAILDLGYLLLTSHIEHKDELAVQPDAERIKAIIQGYYRQRTLSATESSALLDALRFDIALHAAQAIPPLLRENNWQQGNWIRVLQTCYAISSEIATLAQYTIEQEFVRSP